MLAHTVPEMVRTPLDELVLQIGLLYERRRDADDGGGGGDDGDGGRRRRRRKVPPPGFAPLKFLSLTPTPPAEAGLLRACRHLLEVGALRIVDRGTSPEDPSGWLYRLTPLGVSF